MDGASQPGCADCSSSRTAPLLSVGKRVRVNVAVGSARRADIECINEAEGTVDVAFVRWSGWKVEDRGQSADPPESGAARADVQELEEEATVPFLQIAPLQDFEVRRNDDLLAMFRDDLAVACAKIKDEANVLFKLDDYDAAAEHYSCALKEMVAFSGDCFRARETLVLVNSAGALAKGVVTAVDTKRSTADVALLMKVRSGLQEVRRVPWRTLTVIRIAHLQLQIALYLNRARSLINLQRHQEAAWDLSVVIAVLQRSTDPTWSLANVLSKVGWLPCSACARRRQAGDFEALDESRQLLVKAHFLRAKTRLSRLKLAQARADIAKALSLSPPQEMIKELRALEDKINAAHKQELASNKRLRKEICKLADDAMSKLTGEQLSSFAGIGGAT